METKENFSYIYGAARTPIGKFMGGMSTMSAPQLGAVAIREAVKRSGVSKDQIDEVIMGNVISAGIGQAPARQAAINSGLPYRVGATTVNKVCGSGLKAVMLADDAIRLQQARYVVAGGMENMSLAPFVLPHYRKGKKIGNAALVDSLIHDGLWDSFENCPMGAIAEKFADSGKFSREAQDRFAVESYRRARDAQDRCAFSKEIVEVTVSGGKTHRVVKKDEQPFSHEMSKLSLLPVVFKDLGGTITAGNASSINDGAAALVLGPYNEKLKPLARVVGHVAHSEAPDRFPVAPIRGIEKLLDRWPIKLDDVNLFEINEAFSVAILAVCDSLGIDMKKTNVNGGAVALGHPIGASGARILVTLIYALMERNLKTGIAAICLGGGESVVLGIEMVN